MFLQLWNHGNIFGYNIFGYFIFGYNIFFPKQVHQMTYLHDGTLQTQDKQARKITRIPYLMSSYGGLEYIFYSYTLWEVDT